MVKYKMLGLTADSDDWINVEVADYYDKSSVILQYSEASIEN